MFLGTLNDTGTAFSHPRARQLKLDDIFVYPRLTCWSAEDLLNTRKKGTPVPSKEAVEHFRNSPRVLVSGADDSGKTSLLKKLYLDLSGEFAPILIQATSLGGHT
jgi:polynucleotide 5'-kinase involved in rRNA processing